MKNQIFKLILLSTLFFSCKEDISIQEFKSKFDWSETTCIVTGRNSSHAVFTFYHEAKKYIISGSPCTKYNKSGSIFKMIYDKKDPENNYIILYDQPVTEHCESSDTIDGYITGIDSTANFTIVYYKVKAEKKILIKALTGGDWCDEILCTTRDNYKLIEYYKKNKIQVKFNIFYFNCVDDWCHSICTLNLEETKNN